MNAIVPFSGQMPDQAALSSLIAETLVAACCEQFGDALHALILTGSAARHEVTARMEGEQVRLLSDVEAVVVLHDATPLPARESIDRLARTAEQTLAPRLLTHVGLSVVHAQYLRALPPAIYSFELRACGQVLCGDTDVLELIPHYRPTELSHEDAWRLLSNRLVELRAVSASEERPYRLVKLCLDLATSLLVFTGEYVAGYGARLEKLETLTQQGSVIPLPIASEELLPALRWCTRVKLRPGSQCELDLPMAEQIERLAWQAWRWELRALVPHIDEDSPERELRALGVAYGSARRLRGWLFAARRVGWLRSVRYWPKWSGLYVQGLTPRYAVYLANWRLQQATGFTEVAGLLPVVRSGLDAAAQLGWNYQEFVTETRA